LGPSLHGRFEPDMCNLLGLHALSFLFLVCARVSRFENTDRTGATDGMSIFVGRCGARSQLPKCPESKEIKAMRTGSIADPGKPSDAVCVPVLGESYQGWATVCCPQEKLGRAWLARSYLLPPSLAWTQGTGFRRLAEDLSCRVPRRRNRKRSLALENERIRIK
jgi:hypothetical protein